MKTILVMCWVAGSALMAQVPAGNGGLRIVNAFSGVEGKMRVSVDGSPLNDRGYSFGDVTGIVRLPAGLHRMSAGLTGARAGSLHFNVAEGETVVMVAYGTWMPPHGQSGGYWKIGCLRLGPHEAVAERSAMVVSVAAQPSLEVGLRNPDGGLQSVRLDRLASIMLPIRYPRGYVPVWAEGKEIASVPVATSGTYVVVVHDDFQGHLAALTFREKKIVAAD